MRKTKPPKSSHAAPAAEILHFPKRTASIYVRCPVEIREAIQTRADQFFMSAPSYALRVLVDHIGIKRISAIKASGRTA